MSFVFSSMPSAFSLYMLDIIWFFSVINIPMSCCLCCPGPVDHMLSGVSTCMWKQKCTHGRSKTPEIPPQR